MAPQQAVFYGPLHGLSEARMLWLLAVRAKNGLLEDRTTPPGTRPCGTVLEQPVYGLYSYGS